MDLSGVRTAYKTRANAFLEDDITIKDPFNLFGKWYDEAKNTPTIKEPTAMCLATATKDGFPSARFVLLKAYGDDGFQFYTHYTSRKGQELEENPNVALTFYWADINKSIRIEGAVKKLPMSYAEKYFHSRPYESQIGSLCSDQSKPIESRQKLIEEADNLSQKYKEGEVPKPTHWGGYLVVPKSIEFWQGQTDRIHDRINLLRCHSEEPGSSDYRIHGADTIWRIDRIRVLDSLWDIPRGPDHRGYPNGEA